METLVQAECPSCRQVSEQGAGGFVLYRRIDHMDGDFYTFVCGACGAANAKPAPVQVAALLLAARVRVMRIRTPLELTDTQRAAVIPVGWDDVLDFISELSTWDGVGHAGVAGVDRTGEGAKTAGA